MTITATPRQKSKPNYFVYYNDWTGEIVSVGTSLRSDSPATYLQTDNVIAYNIMRGLASEQDYIVVDGADDQKTLVGKSEFLHLRNQEDQLFLLPRIATQRWDIRIRLFTKNNKLIIDANQNNISKLVSHNARSRIKLDAKTAFEFYLIRENNPDHLIEVISVDAEELINNAYMSLDISHLSRYASMTDLAFMTRRYFENYDTDESRENATTWQVVQPLPGSHIELVQQGKYITVNSLVSADQLFDDAGLWKTQLEFFVVGDTPDHYMGSFSIDISRLRIGQLEKYQVDFDIDQIDLIYTNPKLRVSKRKME